MDPEQEIAALGGCSARAAGTDAERRAARHLEGRLRAIGRQAELEPLQIWPRAGADAGPARGHYDSARDGAVLRRLSRRLRDPWAVMLGAIVLLFACCAMRVAGVQGTVLSAVQFVATVLLVVLTAVLVESELSGPSSGADHNRSGVVTAPWVAERLGGRLEHFDLWVVLTGAQRPFVLGMSEWLRRHRRQLGGNRTVVVGLHGPGAGDLVFARRHERSCRSACIPSCCCSAERWPRTASMQAR